MMAVAEPVEVAVRRQKSNKGKKMLENVQLSNFPKPRGH